ncbi:FecR domain-containing protein [candidate division KSB1 bacterium]|nr:FecR domain-containing protein [candidate division KSB1 bacterium]
MRATKRGIIFPLTMIIIGILSIYLYAQGEGIKTVIVREGQGARELAQEVLGEPDLWNEILKSNQLLSPSDLRPGMKLEIPVAAIKRSLLELEKTRRAIQQATDVGARVFTPETIAQAIAFYNDAVKERKAGNWDNSYRMSFEARQLADKSHAETLEKRNTTADAVVTDRSGTVQSRESAEMLWRDLSLYSKLYENNRVRTLSNSYAEISFQDQSRIRLNENSQAVIQKMRVDLLKKERDSSVKLEKGAAFALLQTNHKKKKFNLNIPGVKTEINSKNFWVQKDEDATKIANYEGEIKVSSLETSVIIEENQGSQIGADGSIGKSRTLLSSAELLAPKNNTVLPGGSITLKWKQVAQARRYQLQISADYSFKNIIINRDDILNDSLLVTDLTDGAYYWSVAAIDQDGFPSATSPRGFFYVFSDKDKPFLYVHHPQEQDIFRSDTLHIVGETETDVQLFVNGRDVSIQDGNLFRIPINLADGINKIMVTVRDLGGNETQVIRTVIYASNPEVQIRYDASMKQIQPRQFLARGRTLDLKGSTVPLSSVTIQDDRTGASWRTFADTTGRFQVSLLDIPESTEMTMLVLTPAGYSKTDTLWIQVSKDAPQIILTSSIPAISSEDTLTLQGEVAHAARLQYNDEPVTIVDGKFSHTIKLNPGLNVVKLTAFDQLNNECIIQKEVVLDRTPPELLDYSVVKKAAVPDDVFEIKVKAKDSSGLRRTASVEVEAGDMLSSGFLRFNTTTNTYEGAFKFPRGTIAAVKIKTLVLEDYYGNQKIFYPD